MKNIFRIKNMKTGLYSMGGFKPCWTKEGKIWRNIGDIKTYLRQIAERGSRLHKTDEWVVEEYQITETHFDTINVPELIKSMKVVVRLDRVTHSEL